MISRMKTFVVSLEKELAGRLRKIESSDLNILKKSLEASLVLGDAFQRLRELVSSYTFESEAEEIEFFKMIKPRLYCRLIYYRKVYNIEMNRPVGIESQHAYLHDEIKAIDRYNGKHSDFVRYYRSGMRRTWIRCIICVIERMRPFTSNRSTTNATRNFRRMPISWRHASWPTNDWRTIFPKRSKHWSCNVPRIYRAFGLRGAARKPICSNKSSLGTAAKHSVTFR